MIPASLKSFVGGLVSATENNSIKWEEGADVHTYFCAHKSYNLHIMYRFDHDAEIGMYSFRIIRDGKQGAFSVTEDEGDYRLMQNLFSAITINAAGLGDIAEDFFS